MSTRLFTARQALAGLLVAVSLPFLAVAKPPGLPVRVLVDCQTPAVQDKDGHTLFGRGVNTDAGLGGVVRLRETASFEDFIGTFCPGVGDTFEACWRTLTKWVPVTCAPGCCTEKTTRLAVIEILPVYPKVIEQLGEPPMASHGLEKERLQELIDSSEDIRLIELEWQRIWGKSGRAETLGRTPGGVPDARAGEVFPLAAHRDQADD